ncbi:U-box domain-containing protein 2 [Cucumis melo var. makuwa]|uniref:U-box domain-containing protein 2 n=2 Tax=Cucumis melo TaxID=3656 RepID=A0A5D3BYX7_CUCMM|nr:U-box domain-containing protein 2 [Cucumis melo var. makuwa]
MMIPPMRVPIPMSLMSTVIIVMKMLRQALRGSHSISLLPIHNANPLTTLVSSKIDEPNFHLLLDLLSDLSTNAIVLFRLMCFAVSLLRLAGIQEGKDAIMEEGGIVALLEAIEDGSVKWKEFAVLTLLQLCVESVRNRGLLVRWNSPFSCTFSYWKRSSKA